MGLFRWPRIAYNHRMKIIFVFIVLSSLALFAGPLQEIRTQEQFETYLTASGFNGVLMVTEKNRVLYKKAYGVKDFISMAPLTTDDKFQIGSVTKQFIAAALLKLQQEKKLSIDDEVVKYLPLLENFKGISIRDVLNHTSGIANYTDQPSFWQTVDFNRASGFDEILNFTEKLKLEFTPKSKWKYSNSGYIVAGKILEIVSGQTWDQYLKTNFFEPLNMSETGYAPYFKNVSDVKGYVASEEGLVPFEFNMTWVLSAGALHSTVDDLMKWIAIYDTSELLNSESKTEMQTPFLANYALGIGVEKFNNEIKISHNGRVPGFTTALTYLKTSQLKVVKFDNTDGGAVEAGSLALNFFANGFVNALKTKSFPIKKEILSDYLGDYNGSKMNFNIFVKDETLFLQPNDGQPAYTLVANDVDSFRLLGIAGEEFIRNTAGAVTELKHYQGGNISIFKKQTGQESRPVFSTKKINSLEIL